MVWAVATLVTVIVVSLVLCNVRGQFESWEGGYLGKTWCVPWLYSMPFCGYSLLARNVWKDNAEWNPLSIIAERGMRSGGESGDCGEERLLLRLLLLLLHSCVPGPGSGYLFSISLSTTKTELSPLSASSSSSSQKVK